MGCHSAKPVARDPTARPLDAARGSKAADAQVDDGTANVLEVESAATTASSGCTSSRNSASSRASTDVLNGCLIEEDHAVIWCDRCTDGSQKSVDVGHRTNGTVPQVQIQQEAYINSYYEVLGLPQSCTANEIRKAYLDILKICHPDKADQKDHVQNAASAWFRKVNAAYDVLSDPVKRHAYDEAFVSAGVDQVETASVVLSPESRNIDTTDAVPLSEQASSLSTHEPNIHDTIERVQVESNRSSAQVGSWWQGILAQLQIPACIPAVERSSEIDILKLSQHPPKVSDDPCSCPADLEYEDQPRSIDDCAASDTAPKPLSPALKVKEWQFKLKLETKSIERDIKQLQREESRLARKKSVQEQKGHARGASAAQEFADSIAQSQLALVHLEKIRDLTRAVNLDLTTCLYTSKSPSTLVSEDVLHKMEEIATTRGDMQEVLFDIRTYLATKSDESETDMVQPNEEVGPTAVTSESEFSKLNTHTFQREEPQVLALLNHNENVQESKLALR